MRREIRVPQHTLQPEKILFTFKFFCIQVDITIFEKLGYRLIFPLHVICAKEFSIVFYAVLTVIRTYRNEWLIIEQFGNFQILYLFI